MSNPDQSGAAQGGGAGASGGSGGAAQKSCATGASPRSCRNTKCRCKREKRRERRQKSMVKRFEAALANPEKKAKMAKLFDKRIVHIQKVLKTLKEKHDELARLGTAPGQAKPT